MTSLGYIVLYHLFKVADQFGNVACSHFLVKRVEVVPSTIATTGVARHTAYCPRGSRGYTFCTGRPNNLTHTANTLITDDSCLGSFPTLRDGIKGQRQLRYLTRREGFFG